MATAKMTVAPDANEAHWRLMIENPLECWLIVWLADSDLEIPGWEAPSQCSFWSFGTRQASPSPSFGTCCGCNWNKSISLRIFFQKTLRSPHSRSRSKNNSHLWPIPSVHFGVSKCSFYLKGCESFTVSTDHRPLEGVFKKDIF